MSPVIKKAIAIAVVVFIIAIDYYGSYLPWRKSTLFIEAMQSTSAIRTISDFERIFSIPLDYSSPIGQEELVRSVANSIINSLNSIPQSQGIKEMIRYVENYYEPIINRGRGMSFGQNLYLLGALNESAYLKTREISYLNSAEKYFKKAQELGPKRPQPLYGLFDVYRLKGDKAAAEAIGRQIISQWPDDEKILAAFKSL